MENVQFWTIVGLIIASFGTLASVMIFMINKLDGDIKSLSNRMDGHAQRIDQLYTMFCDLLKERK